MDDTTRTRLRERLNWPSPSGDAPTFASPGSTPEAQSVEPESVEPETVEPETLASDPVVDLLTRLADAAERLDDELRATRHDIERLHERIDRLEAAGSGAVDVDELAGMEAVRRTVSASHRALASQLARMFESLEAKLRRPDDGGVLVGAGRTDR